MADIAPVVTNAFGADDGSVKQLTWNTLTDTDAVGVGVPVALFSDKTVTFGGTFATATVVLQGTNDPMSVPDASANWLTLTDPLGNAISGTAALCEAVTENTLRIRPFTSGGGGTQDVDVIVIARLSNNLRT